MKPRWKILITLGVLLLVLIAGLFVRLHVQPADELAAYQKTLRDQGEKLALSELTPPLVAPQDNCVEAVQKAFQMLDGHEDIVPNAMKLVVPGKALIGWQQPDARNFDFTNSWSEFASVIATNQPAIELLHQLLQRPKLDFPRDYTKDIMVICKDLVPLRRAARKLDAAAICELHYGDVNAATTNVLTLLALVHKNTTDGLAVCHLVRLAMTDEATITSTWELLQATNITDAQLAMVQNGWQQLNFFGDAENAFVVERACGTAEIQRFRASHKGFTELSGLITGLGCCGSSSSSGWTWPPDWDAITERPRNTIGEIMWRSSWSYSVELNQLQTEQSILETARKIQTNSTEFYKMDLDAMTSHIASLGHTNTHAAFFRALNISDVSDYLGGDDELAKILHSTLRTEVARRLVVTAIALKRYQLNHGQWPATLNELTPEFLPSVPIDPYDGKPLKYRPNTDGSYLLYSVGEDGVDNGGDPTTPPGGGSSHYWFYPKTRDWVWPQPASAAEMKYFYEHPPK